MYQYLGSRSPRRGGDPPTLLDDSFQDGALLLVRAIVKEYFLPLAIDQADATIACGLCNIRDYLQHYFTHHRKLPKFPSLDGVSDSDRAVYATWDYPIQPQRPALLEFPI